MTDRSAEDHIAAARAAMERIAEREAANIRDREDVRDKAIVAALRRGMRPPQVAKALGLSTSLVRAIERIADAEQRGSDRSD